MPLKLMFITNKPEIARIVESVGVDRVFVDLEYIGKDKRQGGLDTVQNHHSVEDVGRIRSVLTQSELLVRVNPIHEASDFYTSSEEEINSVIEAGADIVMLPFFRTAEEVHRFIRAVGGRAKTFLLFETPEAIDSIDEILSLEGIDEVFIGLNDLSLGYKKTFLFELLADGTVERICQKFKQYGYPYGFGGIASLGKGMLPSEYIIKEHYRLCSTSAILSRSFCHVEEIGDITLVGDIFRTGVSAIRNYEKECAAHAEFFADNERQLREKVREIVENLGKAQHDGK